MKKKIILTAVIFAISATVFTQGYGLPDVELYTTNGSRIQASEITNDSMPLLMVFWKMDDTKSQANLLAIQEIYESNFEEKGIKMIAVCLDNSGTMNQIMPWVCGHDIGADVYIDRNNNFKRAMEIPSAPYTILFDRNMEVYCQFNGYCMGSESIICDKVSHCLDHHNATALVE